MQKALHKPRLICSHIPVQAGNDFTTDNRGNDLSYSTEFWSNDPTRKWFDAGVCTAQKGYKWITKWEEGKNYIITKIIDNNNNLVGYYCDITSTVNRVNTNHQAFDWYLDVFMFPNSNTTILDEDEFETAVKLGYLSQEQTILARSALQEVLRLFSYGQFNF